VPRQALQLLAHAQLAGLGVRLEGVAPPALLLRRLNRFASCSVEPTHLHIRQLEVRPAHARALLDRSDIQVFVLEEPALFGFLLTPRLATDTIYFETAMDVVVRIALAHRLSTLDGLLLHASGWRRPEGVALFFGPSGAGKTATVSQAPAGEFLCDETMAVRFAAGRWVAYGTPFSKSERSMDPLNGALLGAYALEKDEQGRGVRPLSKQDGLARLMRCVMLHGAGASELGGVLATSISLVEAGLVHLLKLRLGQDPWPPIEQARSTADGSA